MVAENKPKPDKDAWMKEAEQAYARFLGDDRCWEKPRTFDEIERHAVEVGDRLTSWLLEKGLGRPSAEPTSGVEAACPRLPAQGRGPRGQGGGDDAWGGAYDLSQTGV